MKYSIDILEVAKSKAPGPLNTYMARWDVVDEGPHNVFLIRGNGKNILLNTGLPQNPGELEILNNSCKTVYPENYFDPKKIKNVQELLGVFKLTVEDIDIVLVNAMGSYATGGIQLFTNAQVYLSRRGWQDMLVPERFTEKRNIIPDSTLSYMVTKGWDKLHLVGDEEELLPGINMFWVGGHHRGSMCVTVETKEGCAAISDSIFIYENFEDGIPIGVTENLFECMDALAKIRKRCDFIIPMHDSRVFDRHHNGQHFSFKT